MSKRVKIRGKENDWYEEVIFRIKANNRDYGETSNLSEYANQLIGKHMKVGTVSIIDSKEATYSKERHTTDWVDYFFWTSIGVLGVVAVMYIISLM